MSAFFPKQWSTKAFWKTFWHDHLRWNILVFAIVFGLLLTIDLVSKSLIYNGDTSGATGVTRADWGGLAFRSQFHTSTTFLDFIGGSIPRWASLLLNYAIVFVFTGFTFTSTNRIRTAALCVAFSGVVGNTIDVTALSGVRNVLYIPYSDNGTFNFADFFIILGLVLVPLTLIGELVYAWYAKRKAARLGASTAQANTNHEEDPSASAS